MKRTIRKFMSVSLLMSAAAFAWTTFSANFATADETVGEKVENAADDVSKDAKKGHRNLKRASRNARGKGSVVEDAKDGVNNAGDDVSHEVKKAKNKID